MFTRQFASIYDRHMTFWQVTWRVASIYDYMMECVRGCISIWLVAWWVASIYDELHQNMTGIWLWDWLHDGLHQYMGVYMASCIKYMTTTRLCDWLHEELRQYITGCINIWLVRDFVTGYMAIYMSLSGYMIDRIEATGQVCINAMRIVWYMTGYMVAWSHLIKKWLVARLYE